MLKKKIITLGFITAFFIVACVTVNIYFPAAEVQKAADQIVGEVRGEEKPYETPKEQIPTKEREKESRFRIQLPALGIAAKPLYAEMNIEVTTPAIRALKESLKERFAQLKPFYDAGRIGETNKGIVVTRDLEGLGLKEKSNLLSLIGKENEDRSALYKEILDANKLGPEHLSEVEGIFANSWRKKAPEGWWIETDEGTWIKKQ